MANENDSKKDEGAKSALAKLEAENAAMKLDLAEMRGMLKALSASAGGPSVSISKEHADHEKKVADARAAQAAIKAKALELAGPKAQTVKYVVGPGGTVRVGLGYVKPGTVIDVPVEEDPSIEWEAYEEKKPDAKPTPPASPRAPRASDREV